MNRRIRQPGRAGDLVPGDTNGVTDVFVHDRIADTTVRVSVASNGAQANAASSVNDIPSIDADGQVVVFTSGATNLIADDNNNTSDTFTHDMLTGRTELTNVASDGTASRRTARRPTEKRTPTSRTRRSATTAASSSSIPSPVIS